MILENQTHAHNEAEPLRSFRRSGMTSSAQPQILWARHTDGAHKVRVINPRHLELVPEAGDPVVFTSKRQLLLALTGTDRHWTFDRYFRTGRHAPSDPKALPALDLLAEFGGLTSSTHEPPTGYPHVAAGGTKAPAPGQVFEAKPEQAKVTVVPESVDALTVALSAVEAVMDEDPDLGIDLVNRSGEVAKLLFAGFGQWIFSAGYDPDDVLQEVYKGLLARNRGKCPWDASKSSFGHYVHMVCRGVLSNYHRKVKRRREFETSGVMGYGSDGDWGPQDVGASQALPAPRTAAETLSGMREAQEALTVYLEASEKAHTQDGRMAVRIVPMVAVGMTRAEIADKLGVSRASVSRGLTYLRTHAARWSQPG